MTLSVSRYFGKSGLKAAAVIAVAALCSVAYAIEISSFEELCLIGVDERYPLNGDYTLVADIGASSSRDSNGGAGFLPIGRYVLKYDGYDQVPDPDSAFTGKFDGGGFTISGLYIRPADPGAENVGLFGFAMGAKISNVIVSADTVAGNRYVGALAGRLSGGTVEKCAAKGAVIGKADVGGLVGAIENGGTVKTCYSAVDVSGESVVGDVGGFAGSVNGAEITECYSIGSVSVDGGVRVGGFAGWLSEFAKLSNSYSMVGVSGGSASSVGGLVGKFDAGCEVKQCYSAGNVSGGGGVGGLIGTGSVASNSYWDKERSGVDTSAGGSLGAVGKTTVQMMTASETGNLSAAAWGMSNNYPYLKDGFFPQRTVIVTATRGGALSGNVTAGGTVHTQRANHWIAGNTVAAKAARVRIYPDSPDSVVIVERLDGWYLPGSDEKLDPVNEYEEKGFSVAEASADGTDGELSISDLTADSAVAIEARFILKKYTLKYIADRGRGSIVSEDVNNGTSTADTLVKSVEHGSVSSVKADPKEGYTFLRWGMDQNDTIIKNPARTDTAFKDMTFTAYFQDSVIELSYSADENGRLRVNGAGATFQTYKADPPPKYGESGPSIQAIPIYPERYRFVKWDDGDTSNPRVDSAVTASVIVKALFEAIPVAVKSPDRVIPNKPLIDETAQIQPIKAISGGLTAGPNPISRQSGKVNLYWQGREVTKGTLQVFDASGNFVTKISISGINNKYPIAAWNLTNAKGIPVGAGTYLIKGTLSTKNGKREKVALIVSLI